jgi:hypothetical protein
LRYGAERGVNSPDAVPVINDSEEQQRYRAEDEVGEKRSLSGHYSKRFLLDRIYRITRICMKILYILFTVLILSNFPSPKLFQQRSECLDDLLVRCPVAGDEPVAVLHIRNVVV